MERTFPAVGIGCVSYSMNGGSLVCLPWLRRGGGGKERAFKASSLTCDTTVHLRQAVGWDSRHLPVGDCHGNSPGWSV